MDFLSGAILTWRGILSGLEPWWPVLIVAIGIEILRPGRKIHWVTVVGNVIYIPLGLTAGAVVLGPVLEALQQYVPADIMGLRHWANTLPKQLCLWFFYLICFDFLYYWLHRAQHQISWLWRYHMVHHSDVNTSASTVGRHHWLEEGFRFFIITAPLIILMGGVEGAPSWVLTFIVLNGVFMHWNVSLRFGLLERWVITPAYHRLHHSIEERHYDTNFGVFTQLWDRVFGTRMLPGKGDYPETGLQDLTSMRSWALLAPWPLLWLTRKNERHGAGEIQKQ